MTDVATTITCRDPNGDPFDVESFASRTAELFNPSTGSWSPAGTMRALRAFNSATLLPNGKVLVAGGTDNSCWLPGSTFTADLYDPATGAWLSAGNMRNSHAAHTATLLSDGRVLVAGGYDSATLTVHGRAELYDPATNSWSATGTMNVPRVFHAAALLPNGKVLIAGGNDAVTGLTASAELYDPSTGVWTNAAPMKAPALGEALLLADGRVLTTGNTSRDTTSPQPPELYDPATGTWTVTACPRLDLYSAASLLKNGQVLVTGGTQRDARAFVYDPRAGTCGLTASMTQGRHAHTATLLPDGTVLIAGGYVVVPRSAELYVPDPLARVEFVDPNPDLLDDDGNVIQTGDLLATGGRMVTGVAADGVTLVLLRAKTDSPITFSLRGPEDGALLQLDGTGASTSLTARPRSVAGDQWVFALYRAPLDFYPTDKPRPVWFILSGSSVAPCDDESFDGCPSLELMRPPVVLVHGVWSDGDAWKGLEDRLKTRGFPIFTESRVDYGRIEPAPSFDPLKPSIAVGKLIGSIRSVLTAFREQHVAATQVDVVGHSLGGLVARARVKYKPNLYRRRNNLGQGDFHKIITVGTPHLGTPIADYLLRHRCDTITILETKTLEQRLKDRKHPLGAAIYGFQTVGADSPLLQLGVTDVPSHAIVGVEPEASDTEDDLNTLIRLVVDGAAAEIDPLLGRCAAPGCGEFTHDTIVPLDSQRGGLTGAAITEVRGVVHAPFELKDTDVTETISSEPAGVWDQVEKYLREPITPESFGYFPAPTLPEGSAIQPDPCPEAAASLNATATSSPASGDRRSRRRRAHRAMVGQLSPSSLAIVSLLPAPGTVVRPGDTVTVQLSVDAGNSFDGVLFAVGNLLHVERGAPGLSFAFEVPEDHVGRVDIFADTFGPGPDNYSVSTFIWIQPDASLTSLDVRPSSISFAQLNDVDGFSVSGDYSDGIRRDLTGLDTGTTYAEAGGQTDIVNVSENGLVTPYRSGSSTITISNGGVSVTVPVMVHISETTSTTTTTLGSGSTTTMSLPSTTTTSLPSTATTTTTIPPCTSARCIIDAGLMTPACSGQSVPASITKKFDRGATLVEQLATSAPKRAKPLLRRARKALNTAKVRVARAAKGKKPKITSDCAKALRDAIDSVVDRLAVYAQISPGGV